jgi:hypothetical protein
LRRSLSRALLVAALACAFSLAVSAVPAAASGNYPSHTGGWDISWPQCGGPYPPIDRGTYGIVGINDGRPQTENPCFGSELSWAMTNPSFAGIYLNVAYGTSYAGPYTCDGSDHGCQAYNYGWLSAQYAYVTALVDSAGLSELAPNWWLDVEVGNSWNDDRALNAAVIQGALDYFQQAQGIQAGVYSVEPMWREIAGSYAPAGVPNWVAGGGDGEDFATCGQPLWPGGQAVLFQSLTPDGMFDVDRGC